MFARRSRALDEKRVMDYLEGESTLSETPVSLARKLSVDVRAARRVLDHLVGSGKLHRRAFQDIEPIYYRYPSLEQR